MCAVCCGGALDVVVWGCIGCVLWVGMSQLFTKYHLLFYSIIHPNSTYYSQMHTLLFSCNPSLDDVLCTIALSAKLPGTCKESCL